MAFNEEFIGQVKALYRAEKIESDIDLARRLGFSKSVVSSYVNGKVKASKNFLKKFAEVFKNDLEQIGVVGGNGEIPYVEGNPGASPNLLHQVNNPVVPSLRVKVPGFEDCKFATNVYGHSMWPTFENGSIIICKQIEDFELIAYGECFLIITEEQSLVKRIYKHPKEPNKFVLAVSDNKDNSNGGMAKYAPMDIPIRKILELYIIKGTVKRLQL